MDANLAEWVPRVYIMSTNSYRFGINLDYCVEKRIARPTSQE
jgi:hypothetical protein